MLPISNSRSSGQRRRQLTLGVWLAIASAPGWCAVADSAGADADSEHGGSGVSLAALDLSAFGASAHDFDMAEAADPDGGTPLYLDVYFDERPAGRLVELRRRGGRLYITPQGLTALDVVPPQPLQPGADGWVPLDSIPGLQHRYDAAEQRLVLSVPPGLRPSQNLGYRIPDAVTVTRDAGALLGWEAYGRHVEDSDLLSVASRWRWFGRLGALEVSGVSRGGDDDTAWERLDTHWSYSDSTRMTTTTVGDLTAGGLAWTRPVRLGGVQYRRNFGTRPDLVTYPVPRFSGQATVPSAVELLVDNVRQFGTEVNDGPFVIEQFPRISGAGDVTVVLTDALGRVTQTTVPLYVDYQRLATGLSDFSFEAGRLRDGYGGGSDRYGNDWLGSASIRHGITDSFTVEGHVEGGAGLALTGLGAVWSPAARYGVLNLAYAVGSGDSDGSLRRAGYQWNNRNVGIDLQSERRSHGLRDLGDALDPGGPASAPRSLDRVSGWTQFNRGSLGYTWLRSRSSVGREDRLHSVSWSQSYRQFSLSASAFESATTGYGLSLTMSMPLGADRSFSTYANHSEGGDTDFTADLRHDAPYAGGWGWDLQGGRRGDGEFGQASLSVRGSAGEGLIGMDRTNGRTGVFGQAGGSLVWMGDHAFATRRVGDAMVLVDTNGTPGVPVLVENRIFGMTDSDGFLLLPEARGWQRNRIAIDPDVLGYEYLVTNVEQFATPADEGAVRVRFDIHRMHPATVTLLDRDGKPLPAGTPARVGKQEILVAYDGQAWVPDMPADASIEAELQGYRCRFTPRLPQSREGQMQERPLPCEVIGRVSR
jgi:outer membrane usher protein